MGQLRAYHINQGSVTFRLSTCLRMTIPDPAPNSFCSLGPTTNLERKLVQLGIYPAKICWFQSLSSWHLRRYEEQYVVAAEVKRLNVTMNCKISLLSRYDELSDEEKTLGCTCPSYSVLLVQNFNCQNNYWSS